MRTPSRPVAAGLVLGLLLAVVLSVALPVWAGRNSSGTYSLPPGNPVTSGTPISSTWANNTLSDIATGLSDSLDRHGRGGMSQPLALSVGSAAAPGLTFSGDTDTGLYRPGANSLAAVAAGAAVQTWTTTGTTLPGTLGLTGAATMGSTLAVTGATTLSSTLAVTGATTVGSTLGVTGSLTVDTDALFVDTALNRVGINDNTPEITLDVEANTPSGALVILKNTSASGYTNIDFHDHLGNFGMAVGTANASASQFPGNNVILLGKDLIAVHSGAQKLAVKASGVTIGDTNATPISGSFGGTFNLDFPSVGDKECHGLPVTLNGAAVGGVCTVSMANTVVGANAAVIATCTVAATNTVHIGYCNMSGTSQNPLATDFRVRVWQP